MEAYNAFEAEEAPEELGEHLQAAVDKSRPSLAEAAAKPATQSWLKPRLATPEGTDQVYGALEKVVSRPSYLSKLTSALSNQKAQESTAVPGNELKEPEWWEAPQNRNGHDAAELQGFEQVNAEEAQLPVEPLDSYVLVEREDVLEAIGTFLAAYLAELPQAQSLQPAELQSAIKHALKELRKSKMQQLWGWGRAIYRCLAFSYGAFSVYENPWLVRALLAALWTASRMMFGLLV